MISRRRTVFLLLLVAITSVVTEETPPGLVSQNTEQDLVAEATHSGNTAQKREAPLSNSYGEPLPPDAYGPPKDLSNLVSDLHHPAPVYGVPDFHGFHDPPPGAYGPPAPVNFPNQAYHGPPPPVSKPKPIYGPPKIYGSPKPVYGPPKLSLPKQVYGPPKKNYGPPKQSLPKPIYGVPFKPPKFNFNKPIFNAPQPVYGPPKPVYGPPKINFAQSIISSPPPLPLPDLPAIPLPPLETNNIDSGLNLPAPIYGTPLVSLPVDLKPNFPLPSETYGPPGQVIGTPIGPEQVVFQNIGNVGHYGPPQPDPNPQPPHPGIPAPPTPPHVLYDGWKPIPGLSIPLQNIGHDGHHEVHHEVHHQVHHEVHHEGHHEGHHDDHQDVQQDIHQEVQIHLDQPLPNVDQYKQFSSSAQISSGYANVHQDALANIDLNAIVGGDSNGIDQSKTVFEAHYTENQNRDHQGFSFAQVGVGDKPADSYGAPPADTFSTSGPYPASLRQQGAKGLVAPSGFYGVPLGSQYGAPPRHNANLPLPYGYHTGGGHSGLNKPQKPIKFREAVPDGLFESLGHVTQHKDHHGIDHVHSGPTYLPPPIRDVKDVNIHSGNSAINSVSLSIEPTNLYSLPHSGNPLNFQQQEVPSNLYGSPIDSYAAPLLTVHSGDHVTSGSNTNAVTSTIDGTVLANLSNLSNLDAAAILKHCPYHEAILKAAQLGEKIPADLATSYINSLNSLGNTLNKSSNTITIPDSFTKDITYIHPNNEIRTEKRENYLHKGKVFNEKNERLKLVDQIKKTSDRIRDLNKEAQQLQQKIAANNQNLQTDVPIPSKIGSYSVQIQGSNNQRNNGVPHDQLLSEGLLQSILQAVEDPKEAQQQNLRQQNTKSQQNFRQQNTESQQNFRQQNTESQQNFRQQNTESQPNFRQEIIESQQNFRQQNQNTQTQTYQQLPRVNYQNFFSNQNSGDGIVLPEGYEPIDHSKEQKSTDQTVQASEQKIETQKPCDLKIEHSERKETVSVPDETEDKENEVSVFFNDIEPVTEVSVATSISEEEFSGKNKA